MWSFRGALTWSWLFSTTHTQDRLRPKKEIARFMESTTARIN
jgi:hypothetical protein